MSCVRFRSAYRSRGNRRLISMTDTMIAGPSICQMIGPKIGLCSKCHQPIAMRLWQLR